MISARDALVLGRVSNLPTVWANLLAAVALAGTAIGTDLGVGVGLLLFLAYTLFYVGGMYLNDAFDARIDAKERPERPIPAGRVTSGEVYLAGFGMLAAGLVLLGIAVLPLKPMKMITQAVVMPKRIEPIAFTRPLRRLLNEA